LQQLHRARRIGAMGGLHHKPIELPAEPHEGDVVVGLGGTVHAARNVQQLLALLTGRTVGAGTAKKALKLAAYFQHEELMARIEVRYQNSLTRQDDHEALVREPLQRLADRSAADVERGREHLLRKDI